MRVLPKSSLIFLMMLILVLAAIAILGSNEPRSLAELAISKKIMAISPQQKKMLANNDYINLNYQQITLIKLAADKEAKEWLNAIHAAEENFYVNKKPCYTASLRGLNIKLPPNLFHKYTIKVNKNCASGYTTTAEAKYDYYPSYSINENGLIVEEQ